MLELYGFLDWMLALPEEASRRFQRELSTWEEERKVPYITSYERFGIEKGIEQGITQGQQEMLLKQLRTRFHEVSEEVEKRVRKLDQATLDEMADRILTAQTLAEMGLGDDTSTTVH